MNTLLKSNPLKRTENQEKKIICILWDRLKSKPVYTQGKIAQSKFCTEACFKFNNFEISLVCFILNTFPIYNFIIKV